MTPLILPFRGIAPRIAADAFIAPNATIIGDVEIAAGANIWFGCVLRGETTHYDYVCSETARGLQLAQMDTGLPIIFCVLTCDTLEQAIDRAGLKGGNKGFEAGLAAIEMAQLSRKLIAGKLPSAATKTFPPQKARRK